MYFSNLLDGNVVRDFQRHTRTGTIPFVCSVNERAVEAEVILKDNQIVIGDIGEGENLFAKGLTGEDSEVFLEKYKTGLTYKEIKETEENPFIVVLAKSIKFYVGIKTYVKYINISDDFVLAMLVYGACEFTFEDGTSVPMQRCNATNLDNRTTVEYSGKKLRECTKFECRESGYNLNHDVVSAVIVHIPNTSAYNYRSVSEHVLVFDNKNWEIAKSKAAERKAKLEEERLRKEEEKRQAALEAERKRKEEEEAKAKAVEQQFEEASVGAAAFLQAVSQMS